MLDALEKADTIEKVNNLARKFSGPVQLMEESPTMFTCALHIKNLAKLRRMLIRHDELKRRNGPYAGQE